MCCESQTNDTPRIRRRRVRESVTETLSQMKIELECVRLIINSQYTPTILFYTDDDDDLATGEDLWKTTAIHAGVRDRASV